MSDQEIIDNGICCFCGNDCNPLSQSCGSCTRSLSWYGTIPSLEYKKESNNNSYIEIDLSDEEFRNDNYNGKIYYNNKFMNEKSFRQLIWFKLDEDFEDKNCNYDPRNCSIKVLVEKFGAKFIHIK